jgi:hypothetical protein
MRKIFYMLVTAHCSLVTVNAQPVQQEWVRRFNDTSSAAWQAFSVKSDSMGFIYVLAGPGRQFGFLKYDWNGNLLVNASYWPSGYSSGGGLYFDVSPNGDVYITGTLDYTSQYSWIYTVKFNSGGTFQWGRLYNPDVDDSPTAIQIVKSGNLIVVGGAYGGYGLILNYNPNGDTLWTRHTRPGGYPGSFGKLAIDNSNNLYLTGAVSPPGIPGKCLISKYDPSGNLKWFNTFTIDSTRSNNGHGICLDIYGNLYVLAVQNTSSLFRDCLLKLTNSGTILWSRVFSGIVGGLGGRVSGIPRGPVISSDGNSIYYTTEAANTMGGGNRSVATIKYNSAGDSQWVAVFNGGGVPGGNTPSSIKLDRYNNIYVCGAGFYSGSGSDFATIKYTPSGVQQWVMTYTGILTSGSDGASDLFIDTMLNVYVVGGSPNGISIGSAVVTIKYNQLVGINSSNKNFPMELKLFQNYPNPFNQLSIIKYQVAPLNPPEGGRKVAVSLRVYDLLGRKVADLVQDKQNPGNYSVTFDASALSSGVYFYRLEAGNGFAETKKLILMK